MTSPSGQQDGANTAPSKTTKAKIKMSPNILHFASNIYKAKTMPQGPNQIQLADCCNPLKDFSEHTDSGETWINKFLDQVNLRTARTYGNFSQNTELTDDSIIKISRFLKKFYGDGEAIVINNFNYSRPFILATIREVLGLIKEAYLDQPAKYKEQLEIVINICYAVMEQKNQWKDFSNMKAFKRKLVLGSDDRAEDRKFSKLMSQMIQNTNSKIAELAITCKAQKLRDSTTGIFNLIKENILPNLRSALLHFIFSSPDIPDDLFTDPDYAALFSDENLTYEQFRKSPRLEDDDEIKKFINSEHIFSIVKDYFFSPKLQRLRKKLDEETIGARKARMATMITPQPLALPQTSTVKIELVDDDEDESTEITDVAVMPRSSQEVTQVNPHVLLSSIINDKMTTVAEDYQAVRAASQRPEDTLAALPSIFKTTLRPDPVENSIMPNKLAGLVYTAPVSVYNPGLALMAMSPVGNKAKLREAMGKAKDLYVYHGEDLYYALKKTDGTIAVEKLPIVSPYTSENLKEKLKINTALLGDKSFIIIYPICKFAQMEIIQLMTGQNARKNVKDLPVAIILENYLDAINHTFDDLNKVVELLSDMDHVLKSVTQLGNTDKAFGYYQLMTIYDDLKEARRSLIHNLSALRQLHNSLRRFNDLSNDEWVNSADIAQTKTQRVITSLNGQLEHFLSDFAASLTKEDIVENMDEAADSLACLMARQTLLGGHALTISDSYPILELMNIGMHRTLSKDQAIDAVAAQAKAALMSSGTTRQVDLLQLAPSASSGQKLLKGSTSAPLALTAGTGASGNLEDLSDEEISLEELLGSALSSHPQLTLDDLLQGDIIEVANQPHLEVHGTVIPLTDDLLEFIQINQGIGAKSANSANSQNGANKDDSQPGSSRIRQIYPHQSGQGQGSSHDDDPDHISTDKLLIDELRKEKSQLWDHKKTIKKVQATFYRYDDFSFKVFKPSWLWLLWATGVGLMVHGILALGAGLYRWMNGKSIKRDLQTYLELNDQMKKIESRINAITAEIDTLQQRNGSQTCDETEKLLIDQLRKEEGVLLDHQQTIHKTQGRFDHSKDLYHRVRKKIWYLSWLTGVGIIIHGALLLGTALKYRLNKAEITKENKIFSDITGKDARAEERITGIKGEIEERTNNIGKNSTQLVKSRQPLYHLSTKRQNAGTSLAGDPNTLFSPLGQKSPTAASLTTEEQEALQQDKMNFYANEIMSKLFGDTGINVSLAVLAPNNGDLCEQLSTLLNKVEGGSMVKNIKVRQSIFEFTLNQIEEKLADCATEMMDLLPASTKEEYKSKAKNLTNLSATDKNQAKVLFAAAIAAVPEAAGIKNMHALEAIYNKVWERLKDYKPAVVMGMAI